MIWECKGSVGYLSYKYGSFCPTQGSMALLLQAFIGCSWLATYEEGLGICGLGCVLAISAWSPDENENTLEDATMWQERTLQPHSRSVMAVLNQCC